MDAKTLVGLLDYGQYSWLDFHKPVTGQSRFLYVQLDDIILW